MYAPSINDNLPLSTLAFAIRPAHPHAIAMIAAGKTTVNQTFQDGAKEIFQHSDNLIEITQKISPLI